MAEFGDTTTRGLPAKDLQSILAQDITAPGDGGMLREDQVLRLTKAGGVPSFLQQWVEVPVENSMGRDVVIRTLPDYLALGTDEDYVYVSVNPVTAEAIGQWVGGALLPTRKLVRAIYSAAPQKVSAQPWGPPYDHSMRHTSRWYTQTAKVRKTMAALGHVQGTLTAGHAKDVVIGQRLLETKGERLGIFGWFKSNGEPIQGPGVNWHSHVWWYCDYSQYVRFVHPYVRVDGKELRYEDMLKDAELFALVHDGDQDLTDNGAVDPERTIRQPRALTFARYTDARAARP